MDETFRIIDNFVKTYRQFHVGLHVSWDCLESTSSSSDVEEATLDILDVIHGYGRDFAGPHPNI